MARTNPDKSKRSSQARARIEAMTELLAGYAQRGVFRGFSCQQVRGSQAGYRVLWHRNRTFDVTFDAATHTLHFTGLLLDVPSDSPMYRELKAFVRSRQSGDLPEHRRIDRHKAQVRVYNRKGLVSLVVESIDGDEPYAARKLVQLVHEIFMAFLVEGNYFEYLVEAFDLDPDRM